MNVSSHMILSVVTWSLNTSLFRLSRTPSCYSTQTWWALICLIYFSGYQQLKDLSLLECCLKETLRLRPPIMTMMRMARSPQVRAPPSSSKLVPRRNSDWHSVRFTLKSLIPPDGSWIHHPCRPPSLRLPDRQPPPVRCLGAEAGVQAWPLPQRQPRCRGEVCIHTVWSW